MIYLPFFHFWPHPLFYLSGFSVGSIRLGCFSWYRLFTFHVTNYQISSLPFLVILWVSTGGGGGLLGALVETVSVVQTGFLPLPSPAPVSVLWLYLSCLPVTGNIHFIESTLVSLGVFVWILISLSTAKYLRNWLAAGIRISISEWSRETWFPITSLPSVKYPQWASGTDQRMSVMSALSIKQFYYSKREGSSVSLVCVRWSFSLPDVPSFLLWFLPPVENVVILSG